MVVRLRIGFGSSFRKSMDWDTAPCQITTAFAHLMKHEPISMTPFLNLALSKSLPHYCGIRKVGSSAIFLARDGADKEEIRSFIERIFFYDLHTDCDEIRPRYGWEASCQGTVPPAIVAFLDSWDFESAIRLAISLGGDSDTLACITGGIAEAFHGLILAEMADEAFERLPEGFQTLLKEFEKRSFYKSRIALVD